MTDLIERLEALSAPCKQCDCLIENSIGTAKFKREPDTLIGDSDYRRVEPKPYTASIDAAMTLVPEKYFWSLTMRGVERGGFSACCLQYGPMIWHEAATPAIALCIAALKARTPS